MPRPVVIAAVIGLVGLVFTLQGIGLLGGSAMSGSSFWAIVGIALLIVAGFVGWRALRPAARS